jgi:hypothetical protein
MSFSWERSILDCEPSDIVEAPSDDDKGGVSLPELEVVHVLDRERPTGPGRENTGTKWTNRIVRHSTIGGYGVAYMNPTNPHHVQQEHSLPNFAAPEVRAVP